MRGIGLSPLYADFYRLGFGCAFLPFHMPLCSGPGFPITTRFPSSTGEVSVLLSQGRHRCESAVNHLCNSAEYHLLGPVIPSRTVTAIRTGISRPVFLSLRQHHRGFSASASDGPLWDSLLAPFPRQSFASSGCSPVPPIPAYRITGFVELYTSTQTKCFEAQKTKMTSCGLSKSRTFLT